MAATTWTKKFEKKQNNKKHKYIRIAMIITICITRTNLWIWLNNIFVDGLDKVILSWKVPFDSCCCWTLFFISAIWVFIPSLQSNRIFSIFSTIDSPSQNVMLVIMMKRVQNKPKWKWRKKYWNKHIWMTLTIRLRHMYRS